MPLAIFHSTLLKGRLRCSRTLHSVANAWYTMRLTKGRVNATRLRPKTIRPKRLSAASQLIVLPVSPHESLLVDAVHEHGLSELGRSRVSRVQTIFVQP